jgi:hypothetical protein
MTTVTILVGLLILTSQTPAPRPGMGAEQGVRDFEQPAARKTPSRLCGMWSAYVT